VREPYGLVFLACLTGNKAGGGAAHGACGGGGC